MTLNNAANVKPPARIDPAKMTMPRMRRKPCGKGGFPAPSPADRRAGAGSKASAEGKFVVG